jgi:hypothetical protein
VIHPKERPDYERGNKEFTEQAQFVKNERIRGTWEKKGGKFI